MEPTYKFKLGKENKLSDTYPNWKVTRDESYKTHALMTRYDYTKITRFWEGPSKNFDVNHDHHINKLLVNYLSKITPRTANNPFIYLNEIDLFLDLPYDTGVMLVPMHGRVSVLDKKAATLLGSYKNSFEAQSLTPGSQLAFDYILREDLGRYSPNEEIDNRLIAALEQLFMSVQSFARENPIAKTKGLTSSNQSQLLNINTAVLMREALRSHAERRNIEVSDQFRAMKREKSDFDYGPLQGHFDEIIAETLVQLGRYIPDLYMQFGRMDFDKKYLVEAYRKAFFDVLPLEEWVDMFQLHQTYSPKPEFRVPFFQYALIQSPRFQIDVRPSFDYYNATDRFGQITSNIQASDVVGMAKPNQFITTAYQNDNGAQEGYGTGLLSVFEHGVTPPVGADHKVVKGVATVQSSTLSKPIAPTIRLMSDATDNTLPRMTMIPEQIITPTTEHLLRLRASMSLNQVAVLRAVFANQIMNILVIPSGSYEVEYLPSTLQRTRYEGIEGKSTVEGTIELASSLSTDLRPLNTEHITPVMSTTTEILGL